MDIKEFILAELRGWGKVERVIFPLIILFIICISFILNDSKVALVSAVCGISYTVLAGKGKISCYFFGLAGTMCYAYISYKNHLYGNLLLYSCYYFPMQILGIFKWRRHLDKKSREIIKTSLSFSEKWIYFAAALIGTGFTGFILKSAGDATPYIDALTTVFSVIGLLFTVKRAIEQWYVWAVVNAFSVLMWIQAYLNGSNCFATILMWLTYLIVGIYFLYVWRKEMNVT